MASLTSLDAARLVSRATYASVTIASILVCIKFLAWYWTGALSLQATLVDSILDAAASLLNLFAVRQAYRPPDKEHRFGHGKIEAIAALGQSLFISVTAVWLLYEAIQRCFHPQEIISSHFGIAIMVFSIVLTVFLVWYQEHVIQHTQSAAILADSIHYRSDILINASVIIALGAGEWLNLKYLDPIFGIGIALYILYAAWRIAKLSFHILIDGELSDPERAKILQIATHHPHVLGCHDLKTRSSGMGHFIQLHLELDENLSLKEAHTISDEVIASIIKEFPNAEVIIHEDPRPFENANEFFQPA